MAGVKTETSAKSPTQVWSRRSRSGYPEAEAEAEAGSSAQ